MAYTFDPCGNCHACCNDEGENDTFYCCECGREMDEMEHNYGTIEMPCCIQCYTTAQRDTAFDL